MSLLIAQNLSKTLRTPAGSVLALRDFSGSFESGRTYSIVGPSGCGKSTLLYLLGLLDAPTSGRLIVEGVEVEGLSPVALSALRNRSLGFVFQFHYLLPELTVTENLLLPLLKANSLSLPAAHARVAEVLSAVGLSAKATRPAGALSGGEQQRVAVARALVNSPKIILADEPTGNLDAANSEKIFELLVHSTIATGAALIMVTHNPSLAARCDASIPMLDGVRA